jgi:D-alanine-D-alanine ligase
MKILVLGGGNSSEREVSLRSSLAVKQALIEAGFDVDTADPADGTEAVLAAAERCDLVFPILHGTGGEDGAIQRLLDDTGKPYLGSGAAASELCFDKARLKDVLVENDILTPKSELVTAESFARSPLINQPFVLKPVADGSSVGTMIVEALPYDSDQAMNLLEQYGRMLLEEMIIGTEITVPVLGETALPVIEIVPPEGKVFDYENKYNGATSELCPPLHVSAELQERAQRLAERVHTVSGARHLSRTDMIITETGAIYVLEINTLPGMTITSLFPKAAAVAGMDWKQLAAKLVALATA